MDLYTQALNKCHPQLRDYLDPEVILPHLNSCGLLSDLDSQEIQNPTKVKYQKIDMIKEKLARKGEGWWDMFLMCLGQTDDGTAHGELKTALKNALDDLQQNGLGNV